MSALWSGEFGDAYLERNRLDWNRRVPFFKTILEETQATSVLEVGCNAGFNLEALCVIDHTLAMSGVDVNVKALTEAHNKGFDVVEASALDIVNVFGRAACDLVMTVGVLIHIHPVDLKGVMQAIVDVSSNYVLAVEYFAQQEEAIEYRGHQEALWRNNWFKLYEEIGLSLVLTGEVGATEGFDSCTYWLMQR